MLSKFYLLVSGGLLAFYAVTGALGWEFGDPMHGQGAAASGPSSGGHGSTYHSAGFRGGK